MRRRRWRYPTNLPLLFCHSPNMSGDPEQDYFADGMVEDIINGAISFQGAVRYRRNSSFTYKGRAVDVKQVDASLGCVNEQRLETR